MKLVNKSYGNDYYGHDLDLRQNYVGNPINHKRTAKKQLRKARRVRNKDLIRVEGGAV